MNSSNLKCTQLYKRMKPKYVSSSRLVDQLTMTTTIPIAIPPTMLSWASICSTTIWKHPLAYKPLLENGCWAQNCQKNENVLKFIYSEKATKFCKIFPLLLTVTHSRFRHYFCSNLYGSTPRGPRGVEKSDFFFYKENC